MGLTDLPTGNGSLKIPSWFITAIAVLAAVFSAGWAAAKTAQGDNTDLTIFRQSMTLELQTISTRLCRLERSQHIEPWESCK